jgi:aspartate racemase
VCNADYVNIAPHDVFLNLSPISFDASTLEIWGALLNGARLVLLPPGPFSLNSVAQAINREKITILWLTGGLFNLMVDERLGDLAPVRQLLVGGEVLSIPHIERALKGLPNTQLINGYGPTENTTFTCCYKIPRGTTFPQGVPIGPAIRGTYAFIVDEALQPLPAGEIGELVTGGLGLALGYWCRPELTRERFVADTLSSRPEAMLYRTGDLARQRSDGVFEFVGRRDTQVKLRGFRIELGEIETVLRQHPGVRDCAVVVCGEGAARSLVGYVVRQKKGELTAGGLRQFLSARLPEHLVPNLWEFLPNLPLNPNGKLDRAALSDLKPKIDRSPGEQPKTDLEAVIAALWQEILGTRPFTVIDAFFDVGADSLMVTRLHDRLCKRAGLALELTDLFRYPSVRSLAQYLDDKQPSQVSTSNTQVAERGRAQRGSVERFRRP